MSWMSDGALPLGMLFFASMAFGFMRRKAGHRRALRTYPELAERLSLTYRPSRYRSGIGALSGRYAGFAVVVDPDEQRCIRLRFSENPRVDLRSYARDTGPPHDMHTVFTGDKGFDRYFKTRWAGQRERQLIEELERPGALLEPFRRVREVKEMQVTSAGVTCVFDYGSPPYIPAERVEELLPAMTRIARVFEPADER